MKTENFIFDRIELCDTHWDCDCDKDYLKPNSLNSCDKCEAIRDEQPDSRVNELEAYLSE